MKFYILNAPDLKHKVSLKKYFTILLKVKLA